MVKPMKIVERLLLRYEAIVSETLQQCQKAVKTALRSTFKGKIKDVNESHKVSSSVMPNPQCPISSVHVDLLYDTYKCCFSSFIFLFM